MCYWCECRLAVMITFRYDDEMYASCAECFNHGEDGDERAGRVEVGVRFDRGEPIRWDEGWTRKGEPL